MTGPGTGFAQWTRAGAVRRWTLPRSASRATAGNRLLDVACGSGLAVELARRIRMGDAGRMISVMTRPFPSGGIAHRPKSANRQLFVVVISISVFHREYSPLSILW